MNKRARLTRRILREHRQGAAMHFHNPRHVRGWGEIWFCTHCPWLVPGHDFGKEIPRAYR